MFCFNHSAIDISKVLYKHYLLTLPDSLFVKHFADSISQAFFNNTLHSFLLSLLQSLVLFSTLYWHFSLTCASVFLIYASLILLSVLL